MSGDDWSAVIDEQTQETVVPQMEEAAAGPIVSPFSNGMVQQNSGATFDLSKTFAIPGIESQWCCIIELNFIYTTQLLVSSL